MERTLTMTIFTVIALIAAALIIMFVIQHTKGSTPGRFAMPGDDKGIAGRYCPDATLVCASVEDEPTTVRRCDLVDDSTLICEQPCPCE